MLKYFERFLKIMGFKKYMWMHVTGFMIFVIMMFMQLLQYIINGEIASIDVKDSITLLFEILLVYICLRIFQTIFDKKVKEDSYMYFWIRYKKEKKDKY